MTYQSRLDAELITSLADQLLRHLQNRPPSEMLSVVEEIHSLMRNGFEPSVMLTLDLKKQLTVWTKSTPFSSLSETLFVLHGRSLLRRMEQENIIRRAPDLRLGFV